jgi:hypothetical protein
VSDATRDFYLASQDPATTTPEQHNHAVSRFRDEAHYTMAHTVADSASAVGLHTQMFQTAGHTLHPAGTLTGLPDLPRPAGANCAYFERGSYGFMHEPELPAHVEHKIAILQVTLSSRLTKHELGPAHIDRYDRPA